ncbi:hypothetical protein [Pyxidicoccus sp. MSG2]|uniref:hypothetical protein n=1 Tax=Pyxidicoccus sp. MSG2 TaxID=2996790 RepID=UPI002D1E350B|nr:hypothetical protein [Pyxidicoccus sp. MSG2]
MPSWSAGWRFTEVAVLRPDGCLAWVRSGKTQQRVGDVEWKYGAFRAGLNELGTFYSGKGGVFRQLNAVLEEAGQGAFTDVHDDADYAPAHRLPFLLGQLTHQRIEGPWLDAFRYVAGAWAPHPPLHLGW